MRPLPMPQSSNATSPLELYQQLAQISSQIIDCIQQEQWTPAAELCHVYADVLGQLKHLPGLTSRQQKARRALLGIILTNDAEIRAYLNPQSHLRSEEHTSELQSRGHLV